MAARGTSSAWRQPTAVALPRLASAVSVIIDGDSVVSTVSATLLPSPLPLSIFPPPPSPSSSAASEVAGAPWLHVQPHKGCQRLFRWW